MKERGILFSAPMIRARLRAERPKTHTRRAIKGPAAGADVIEPHSVHPGEWWPWRDGERLPSIHAPYGLPGDRLWARENFRLPAQFDGNKPSSVKGNVKIWYEADGAPPSVGAPFGKLRPSIHLPRVRSRDVVELVEIRVERLHDITEADALAEGILAETVIIGVSCYGGAPVEHTAERYYPTDGADEDQEGFESAVDAYAALWDRINGAGAWGKNPWVWVLVFKAWWPL